MRFAPVCPIQVYEAMEKAGHEYLGDYFLLLAHDILEHSSAYARFFRNRNATIIVDNSVIELGNACTAANLYEAARVVGQGNDTCVAIPDVLQDGVATLERAKRFFDEAAAIPDSINYGKMFIPQGKDVNDFSICIEEAVTCFADQYERGIAQTCLEILDGTSQKGLHKLV